MALSKAIWALSAMEIRLSVSADFTDKVFGHFHLNYSPPQLCNLGQASLHLGASGPPIQDADRTLLGLLLGLNKIMT